MPNDVNKYANKDPQSRNHSLNNKVYPKKNPPNNPFIDNRPEAALQRKYQEMANNSPQAAHMAQRQSMADNHAAKQIIQKADANTNTHNNTGLPDHLKSGMESLSGMNLNHVKVHYNSAKPAAVQAHAYAQGHDIHLGAGQEKHLPHELGHVVQQAQGRVNPTTTVGGLAINDNAGLEKEADVLGAKALQRQPKENNSRAVTHSVTQKKSNGKLRSGFVDNCSATDSQNGLQLMAKMTRPFVIQKVDLPRKVNAQANLRNILAYKTIGKTIPEGGVIFVVQPEVTKRFTVGLGGISYIGTQHTQVKSDEIAYWLKSSRIANFQSTSVDDYDTSAIPGYHKKQGTEQAPDVGWKLHISAQKKDVQKVIEIATGILQLLKITHKIESNALKENVPAEQMFGKLITAYINNENAHQTLKLLESSLQNIGTPLDKRDEYSSESGRVHLRYGANSALTLNEIVGRYDLGNKVTKNVQEVLLKDGLKKAGSHSEYPLIEAVNGVFYQKTQIALNDPRGGLGTTEGNANPGNCWGAYLDGNIIRIDTREEPNPNQVDLPPKISLTEGGKIKSDED